MMSIGKENDSIKIVDDDNVAVIGSLISVCISTKSFLSDLLLHRLKYRISQKNTSFAFPQSVCIFCHRIESISAKKQIYEMHNSKWHAIG